MDKVLILALYPSVEVTLLSRLRFGELVPCFIQRRLHLTWEWVAHILDIVLRSLLFSPYLELGLDNTSLNGAKQVLRCIRSNIRLRQRLDVSVPVCLMVGDVKAQHLQDFYIEPFDLTIGLRMVRAFDRVLDAK